MMAKNKINKTKLLNLNHEKVLSKAKESAITIRNEFKKEFKKQTVTAITAAFALIIALSWNDAIKEIISALINSLKVQASNIYLYKIYTATIVTIVCVIAIVLFSRWSAKESSKT